MVRTFLCHPFNEPKSFSDRYEPTALCCKQNDVVFVASSSGTIHQYNIGHGTPVKEKQFASTGVALKMIYCDKRQFLVSLEAKLLDYKVGVTPTEVSCQVRIYLNKHLSIPHRVYTTIVNGYSATSEKRMAAVDKFTIVELIVDHSVTDVSVCSSKSNIAVASGKKVYIFSYVEVALDKNLVISKGLINKFIVDFYPLIEVESKFLVKNVSLFVNWLAFSSNTELRVVQMFLNEVDGDSCMGEDVSELLDIPDNINTITKVDESNQSVHDEFIVWNFESDSNDVMDASLTSDGTKACLTTGNKKFFWADETNVANAMKHDSTYIDDSVTSKECLGYFEDLVGHPLRISSPCDGRVTCVTRLYRRFESSELSISGIVDKLHSLQWLPVYTDNAMIDVLGPLDNSLNLSLQLPASPCLLTIALFVSTGKHGYLYDLTRTPENVATYSYTSDCFSAEHTYSNLNTVTKNGLEVYTSRLYALASEHYQNFIGESDKKVLCKENENVTDVIKINRSSTDLFMEQNYFESYVNITKDLDESNQLADTSFIVHLHDSNYLAYPCLWRDVDLCLVGMFPLPSILLTASTISYRVLGVKNINGSEKKSFDGISQWSIYILEKPALKDIFENIMLLIKGSQFSNPSVYYQLLSEAHLFIRSNMLFGLNKEENTELKSMFKLSAHKLADFFASCDSRLFSYDKICLFYEMASITFKENIQSFSKKSNENQKYGAGMIFYLNKTIFGDEMINFDEKKLNFILDVYLHEEPALLSKVILHSQLIIRPEVGLKYLIKHKENSNERISTLDDLSIAILHMNHGDPSLAEAVIKDMDGNNLVATCVENFELLYSDDNVTPIGHLLKKRYRKEFVNILVRVFISGKIEVDDILEIFRKEKSLSFKACDVLEAILNDPTQKKYYYVTAVALSKLYISKLVKGLSSDCWKSNHKHLPKGNGHFALRYKWLDSITPFSGDVPCPQDCIIKQNTRFHSSSNHGSPISSSLPLQNSSGIMSNSTLLGHSSPGKNGTITDLKNRSYCPCCCCSETLMKFQSLLCSKYCRKEFSSEIISMLQDSSFVGKDSLLCLCWPKSGNADECVGYIMKNYTNFMIQYAKDLFDWKAQWQTLLIFTLKMLKDEDMQWNKQAFHDVLKGVLLRLTRAYSPQEFLEFLPDDGNLQFFLPYIVECWQYSQAGKVKQDLIEEYKSY